MQVTEVKETMFKNGGKSMEMMGSIRVEINIGTS